MMTSALLLAGCASTPDQQNVAKPQSSSPPRSITLHHPASGETVSQVYWHSGRYDHDAMREISKLFRDRRSGEFRSIDPELIDQMVTLREKLGVSAETPINITSGYRTQATNASLSRSNRNVADNSYHMRGQAADLHIPGVPAARLAKAAAELQRGGYALYAHTGHVHIDTGPVRTWIPRGPEQRNTDIRMASATSRQSQSRQTAARSTPATAAPSRTAVASRTPAKPTTVAAKPASGKAATGKPAAGRTMVASAPLAKPQQARSQTAGRQQVAAAPGKPVAKPDLSKVRVVLAQLKDQPAPPAKQK